MIPKSRLFPSGCNQGDKRRRHNRARESQEGKGKGKTIFNFDQSQDVIQSIGRRLQGHRVVQASDLLRSHPRILQHRPRGRHGRVEVRRRFKRG